MPSILLKWGIFNALPLHLGFILFSTKNKQKNSQKSQQHNPNYIIVRCANAYNICQKLMYFRIFNNKNIGMPFKYI